MLNKSAKIVLFIALVLGLPIVAMGAQKAITVASLNNAYNAQIASLNADIASSTAAIKPLSPSGPIDTKTIMSNNGLKLKISQDKDDEHTLQVTYQMMFNALQ